MYIKITYGESSKKVKFKKKFADLNFLIDYCKKVSKWPTSEFILKYKEKEDDSLIELTQESLAFLIREEFKPKLLGIYLEKKKKSEDRMEMEREQSEVTHDKNSSFFSDQMFKNYGKTLFNEKNCVAIKDLDRMWYSLSKNRRKQRPQSKSPIVRKRSKDDHEVGVIKEYSKDEFYSKLSEDILKKNSESKEEEGESKVSVQEKMDKLEAEFREFKSIYEFRLNKIDQCLVNINNRISTLLDIVSGKGNSQEEHRSKEMIKEFKSESIETSKHSSDSNRTITEISNEIDSKDTSDDLSINNYPIGQKRFASDGDDNETSNESINEDKIEDTPTIPVKKRKSRKFSLKGLKEFPRRLFKFIFKGKSMRNSDLSKNKDLEQYKSS